MRIGPDQMLGKNYRELLEMIHSEELQDTVSNIEGRAFKPVKREIKAVIGNEKLILRVFITGLKDREKYIGMLVVSTISPISSKPRKHSPGKTLRKESHTRSRIR
jgi:hypothetical protein